ncbi:MAG: DJ-1/PfpI family protein [Acidobacteriota bacterium]
MSNSQTVIGIPIYPNANLLDITGPYQVFATSFWKTKVYLVAANDAPVRTLEGARLVPDVTFAECPQLDVLFVPGGPGQVEMMTDAEYLGFLKRQAESAQYVTSVCTGALLLAAAGLLDGYKATTHWASKVCLELFPEIEVMPGYPRFVVDRNRITGGGVSSGIDEALQIASIIAGREAAESIQLFLQYAPDPPFNAGNPATASSSVYDEAWTRLRPTQLERIRQIVKIIYG